MWWPTHTADDRQKIEVGVPFKRKGEWIIVKRNPKTKAPESKPYYGPLPEKRMS